MKSKNIVSFLFKLFLLLLISFFTSFIVYNYRVLKLKKVDRVIKTIRPSDINIKNDKLIINYKGYVNKLNIFYTIDNNDDIDISYFIRNYYNSKRIVKINENFNRQLHEDVIPIRSNISNFTIKLNGDSNLIVKKVSINNKVSINFYLWFFIFVVLSVFCILFLYLKKNLFGGKIEKLFLCLILSFGSLFIILQPNTTSYSWDDQIHFSSMYRLFELDGTTEWSQGYLYMTDIFPFGKSIDTYEERFVQNDILNSNNKIIKSEKTSPLISYNQVGYIVPGLTMKICTMFGCSTVLTFLIVKFSMLIFYSVLMYFAIKIIPRGKRILAVFALFPSVIFLSTQFTYDTPIIAGISLFIAKFLSIIDNKDEKVDLKNALILLCSIIIPSLIKAIYIPLILLLLFIPKEKFINKKAFNIFKIGIILLFIMISLTFVLPSLSGGDELGDLRGGNTSISGQIKNIMSHPFGYATLLNETAVHNFLQKFIGKSNLINYAYIESNSQTDNLYYSLLLLFVFVVITDSYREKSKKCHNDMLIKISSIVLNLGIIVLIWTALYVSFTPVGATTIEGVQCRYFIPLIPSIVLFIFSNSKIKTSFDMKKYDVFIMSLIALILFHSLYIGFYLSFCV